MYFLPESNLVQSSKFPINTTLILLILLNLLKEYIQNIIHNQKKKYKIITKILILKGNYQGFQNVKQLIKFDKY